jgi:hypothetical protein
VAGGEADPTRWAVGDDVDRVKTVAAAERGGNLLRHRAGAVEEDRLDLGAQAVGDRLNVRDAGVAEDYLASGISRVRVTQFLPRCRSRWCGEYRPIRLHQI